MARFYGFAEAGVTSRGVFPPRREKIFLRLELLDEEKITEEKTQCRRSLKSTDAE